jgi:hypothetical protein
VLAEASFKVASLGFQWTAPIVSEVLAAMDAKAQADLTATSSIPLGLAIGRGDRVRLALTFPFKASYNTRRTPNLSKYFGAFGHLTVLADTGDGFSTELAAGAGVSAFQVFNFGWAISLASNHRNYFLLSLDRESKFALAGFKVGDWLGRARPRAEVARQRARCRRRRDTCFADQHRQVPQGDRDGRPMARIRQ